MIKHTYRGGRGNKVPWKSKVLRVPEPILEQVEGIIEDFYSPSNSVEKKGLIKPDQAVLIAKEILVKNQTSKKSTKTCLEKLLQELYEDKSIIL